VPQREDFYYVHASFTAEVEEEKSSDYLMEFLTTLNINAAFVNVYGGKELACFDYED